MSYTQYGPWTDGGSPGVSAEFLNPLETFLLSLNSAAYDSHLSSDGNGNYSAVTFKATTPGTVLNGGASGAGTVTLWMDCTGNVKRLFAYQAGYKSGSAIQTLALPVAFLTGAIIHTGFCSTFQLMHSGSAQSVAIYTTGNATGTGNTTPETTMQPYNWGEIRSPFDTLSFPINTTSAFTGGIEIIGN